MNKLLLAIYLTIFSLSSFGVEPIGKELIVEVIEGELFVSGKRVTDLEAYLKKIENLDEHRLHVIAYEGKDMSYAFVKEVTGIAKRLGIRKTTLSSGKPK